MNRTILGAALLSGVLLAPALAQGQKPAAPEASSPAAASAPAAAKTIALRVPSGGEYSAYIQESPAAPKSFQDKIELEVPSTASYTVYVLDRKSGYAARKTVDSRAAPAELSFASPDFKLVQKVKVRVTGKDDRPIANGSVTLTDGGKNTLRKIVQPSSQGEAEFDFVVSGPGTVAVTAEDGSSSATFSKEISIDLPRGETAQSIAVPMPQVTATVEPAAGEPTPPTAAAEGAPAPAADPQPAAAPAAAPPAAAPATTPAAQAPGPQAPASTGIGGVIIGWIFLIALLGGAYLFMKQKGITVEGLLKKLGVQPDAVAADGSSLAGANLASGVAAPGPAPAPPPVVSDPNQCPYCGQMKDPSGNCACSVVPGAAAASAPSAGGASAGPRLVGVAGTYMGHVFPISGTAVLGREATNPVPLPDDSTASRRHAQISAAGGGYQIQDLGSSNGTFLNGGRITESVLNPGDEVTIGSTRFRFEA